MDGYEVGIVVYNIYKCCVDILGDYDVGNLDGGVEMFYGYVGGDFGGYVEGEEDGEGIVVLEVGWVEFEIFFEGVEMGIVDVGMV